MDLKVSANEISRFINACSNGYIDTVKSMHKKYGDGILDFKIRKVGDHKYGYYYAIKNGQMEVSRYLKKINPKSSSVNLTKFDVYNLFIDVLSRKVRSGLGRKKAFHDMCVEFIINGLDELDKETVVISAIDACLSRHNYILYEILVDEFGVNPKLFEMRINNKNTKKDKDIQFLREIKIRSIIPK